MAKGIKIAKVEANTAAPVEDCVRVGRDNDAGGELAVFVFYAAVRLLDVSTAAVGSTGVDDAGLASADANKVLAREGGEGEAADVDVDGGVGAVVVVGC